MFTSLFTLSLFACTAKQPNSQSTVTNNVELVSKEVEVTEQIALNEEISGLLDAWTADGKPDSITDERAQSFSDLADWIVEQRDAGKPIQLMFVCQSQD